MARTQNNDITTGVIWKQLLLFFFPILLGTFFQQLYNTVDAAIIGRFAGTEALAAVGGSSAQILNLLVGFFVGLASGATVIVSQYYGAGDGEGVSRAVHTGIALALAAGLMMTVAGVAATPALLRLMNTPEDTMADSTAYVRVVFLAMVPSMVYNVGAGILRAVGDSRRPLYFLIVACLVNVALDLLFVVVLRLAVLGVAIATALAQLTSAALVWICLCRAEGSYRLFPRRVRADRALLLRTVEIGLPSGLQSVMYTISNMIITATINGFGTSAVAAWVTLGKVDGMFWMINGAFGITIMTFAGQNYGARQLERAERSLFTCTALSLSAAWLFSGLFFAFARPVFSVFTRDAQVMDIALTMMRHITPWYWLFVPIEMISGALRGMGRTLVPTLITALGICVFRIIWMFGVVPGWHEIRAITLSYPISWLLTAAAFLVYYLSVRRQLGFGRFSLRSSARAGE